VKRMAIAIALSGALFLVAASGPAAGASPRAAKVQVRHTALGNILANRRGLTLYVFSRDSRKHDSCMAISGCAGIWPVLKTGARPTAGSGVKRSLLGTITLPGGARQVTYAGHPLYTYIGDSGPGQTEYVGFDQFGGRWYAINASGRVVK
jgi:predicted lipoprotein with Yx(FWY)xxD motif